MSNSGQSHSHTQYHIGDFTKLCLNKSVLEGFGILAVEAIQSKVVKCIIGVPTNTASLCAQTEIGMFAFRTLLYKTQLTFYFQVLGHPDSRWVKQAPMVHLSMSWLSPYLANIAAIRDTVQLPFVPPTSITRMFIWLNCLTSRKTLHAHILLCYKRQPYVHEHEHLSTIAQFHFWYDACFPQIMTQVCKIENLRYVYNNSL